MVIPHITDYLFHNVHKPYPSLWTEKWNSWEEGSGDTTKLYDQNDDLTEADVKAIINEYYDEFEDIDPDGKYGDKPIGPALYAQWSDVIIEIVDNLIYDPNATPGGMVTPYPIQDVELLPHVVLAAEDNGYFDFYNTDGNLKWLRWCVDDDGNSAYVFVADKTIQENLETLLIDLNEWLDDYNLSENSFTDWLEGLGVLTDGELLQIELLEEFLIAANYDLQEITFVDLLVDFSKNVTDGDLTLYAIWGIEAPPTQAVINYDFNGGIADPSGEESYAEQITSNNMWPYFLKSLGEIEEAAPMGTIINGARTFLRWDIQPDGLSGYILPPGFELTNLAYFSALVTIQGGDYDELTLYAIWEEAPSPTP
jgi:hypothetical protein